MTNANHPLWDLIPLSRFTAPAPSGTSALRFSLTDLWRKAWRRFRQGDEEDELPELDLRSAPDRLLDWVAPEPDWVAQGQEALGDMLQAWLESDPAQAGIRTLVCAPPDICRPMLIEWAQKNHLFLIEPPTPTQILEADERWFDQWPLDNSVRLVLPRLERCFLRHHNGLHLFRHLLERLWETRPPLVALSDSWGWGYLNYALHAESVFSYPMTLAPFDEERLDGWLRQISSRGGRRAVIFRQTNNGRAVLDTNGDLEEANGDSESKRSSFLTELAIRSRGNPRVAWAIWRHSLRVAVDDEIEEKVEESAENDQGLTIWLHPWRDLALPGLPAGSDKIEAFILHALLIHGGLTDALLMLLMPFSTADVVHGLGRLRGAELIAQDDGIWYVQPLGYPAVRSFLDQEGFPLDSL